MTDAYVQPTLSHPLLSELLDGPEPLGLIDLAAWLALERSTQVRSPFSPQAELTDCLLARLQGRGIIRRLPNGKASRLPGAERAIYEPLAWLLEAGAGERKSRCALLVARIQALKTRDAQACVDILWLWRRLADAELHGYFAHLLRRHGIDPAIAGNVLERTRRVTSGLSLAARRQIVWTTIRDEASLDNDSVAKSAQMEDRLSEIIQRSARSSARRKEECTAFVPSATWRRPLLLGVLLEDVVPLGSRYWTETPQAGHVTDVLHRTSHLGNR